MPAGLAPAPYQFETTRLDPQADLCQVCQARTGIPHLIPEMRRGTWEKFLYWECSECGCLSLTHPRSEPDDLVTHGDAVDQHQPLSWPKKILDLLYLSPLSRIVRWPAREDLNIIRDIRLKKSMSLLEVGCGSGNLIGVLRELGYDAHGIDPHVSRDIRGRFGVRVEGKPLAGIDGEFDVVLFLQSLAQLPLNALKLVRAHIKQKGLCVVRIPMLGWAWRNYGADWGHLDAPRNLFLHSCRSFQLLVDKSNFRIERLVFHSNELQFWGSESLQNRVPLSQMGKPTASQLTRMRKMANDLDQQEQGDTALFYLRPV